MNTDSTEKISAILLKLSNSSWYSLNSDDGDNDDGYGNGENGGGKSFSNESWVILSP